MLKFEQFMNNSIEFPLMCTLYFRWILHLYWKFQVFSVGNNFLIWTYMYFIVLVILKYFQNTFGFYSNILSFKFFCFLLSECRGKCNCQWNLQAVLWTLAWEVFYQLKLCMNIWSWPTITSIIFVTFIFKNCHQIL